MREPFKELCGKCGARRIDQQLGPESTPEEYVAKLIEIFREVKRVLKPEGICWCNLGDSYWGGKGSNGSSKACRTADERGYVQSDGTVMMDTRPSDGNHPIIKSKDLVGIPWRVAFALQADGWWLRQDIIWEKPNPMPESVTDRCTKSHEYIFLLAKSQKYYYDAEAIKEPIANSSGNRLSQDIENREGSNRVPGKTNGTMKAVGDLTGRNKRSVWTITTKPFRGAHFAVFPEDLVSPMILVGTSEKGSCPGCGKPWTRKIEKTETPTRNVNTAGPVGGHGFFGNNRRDIPNQINTLGWKPTCDCGILTCLKCSMVIELRHETNGDNKMQIVREGNPCEGQALSQENILRENLCGKMECETSENNEGMDNNHERIQVGFGSPASQCVEIRLCNGTSVSNGEKIGKIFKPNRNRTSYQRNKIGQQNRKLDNDEQNRSRQTSKTKSQANSMSALRKNDMGFWSCPNCKNSMTKKPFTPQPSIILDCFMGSGTVGVVARKLGRNYLGIELNPKYIDMANRRINDVIVTREMF